MARLLYGATSGDYTMTAGGRVIPNAEIEIWDAIEGGTQITDLTDYDGNPCTVVTSGADGLVRFYGPDGENDNLWMDSRQGSRLLVRPTVLTATIGDGSILDEDIAAAADIDRTKIAGTALTSASMAVFNVRDYGAEGDCVVTRGTTNIVVGTDDTTAIKAAIAAAAAVGGTVVFPPVETTWLAGYQTTDQIDVPGNVSLQMHAPIVYNGAGGEAALVINSDLADQVIGLRHELRAVRAQRSTWASETDVGIVIQHVYNCNITIQQADYFTIGCQLTAADNHGVAYNTFTLGRLTNGKIGLDLYAGLNGGWVNENVFLGGQFSTDSDVNLDKSRYAVRIHAAGGRTPGAAVSGDDGYPCDANVFHKPSFEINAGGLTGGAEAVPLLILDGRHNKFYDCRNEGNSATFMRVSGDSFNNYASTTYGGGEIDWTAVEDTSITPTTVKHASWLQTVYGAQPVALFPDLPSRAVPYDGDGNINVPGLMGGGSDAAFTRQVAGTITDGYIELDALSHLGMKVDCRWVKRFVHVCGQEDYDAGPPIVGPGYTHVRCYDSSGVQLDPYNYTEAPLIAGSLRGGVWSKTGYWGGAYVIAEPGTGHEPSIIVVTNPIVESIYVGVGGVDYPTRISSWRLSTDDIRLPAAWTDFPDNTDLPCAVQAPASGTHPVGRHVLNASPLPGASAGWVCTVAGTPGTWKASGLVMPDTDYVDNLLTPNQASGTDALGDTTGFSVVHGSPVMTSSTEHPLHGSRSLKYVTTETTNWVGQLTTNIPVTPGETITIVAGITASVSQTIRFAAYFNTDLASVMVDNIPVGTTPTEMRITAVVPPGVTTLTDVMWQRWEGAIGESYWLDKFGVWRGANNVWAMPRQVAGARDESEGALASLITQLANLGLITDSTTAS